MSINLEKQPRGALKLLTDEEKKERKRILHREYMSNRRKQDPEFAAKPGECVLNNYKKLREIPEINEKQIEYFKNYQRKMKNEHNEMKKNILENEN
jgi:hypothetical protein